MATKSEVQCWLIEPMTQLYTPPRGTENVKGALGQYLDEFTRYGEEDLRGGWSVLRQTHARVSWPRIQEIKGAIVEYRKLQSHKRPVQKIEEKSDREWEQEAKTSALYSVAVSGGFPSAFVNWVKKHKKLPHADDIPTIRANWQDFEQSYRNEENNPSMFVNEILRLGNAVRKNNQRLIDEWNVSRLTKGNAA